MKKLFTILLLVLLCAFVANSAVVYLVGNTYYNMPISDASNFYIVGSDTVRYVDRQYYFNQSNRATWPDYYEGETSLVLLSPQAADSMFITVWMTDRVGHALRDSIKTALFTLGAGDTTVVNISDSLSFYSNMPGMKVRVCRYFNDAADTTASVKVGTYVGPEKTIQRFIASGIFDTIAGTVYTAGTALQLIGTEFSVADSGVTYQQIDDSTIVGYNLSTELWNEIRAIIGDSSEVQGAGFLKDGKIIYFDPAGGVEFLQLTKHIDKTYKGESVLWVPTPNIGDADVFESLVKFGTKLSESPATILNVLDVYAFGDQKGIKVESAYDIGLTVAALHDTAAVLSAYDGGIGAVIIGDHMGAVVRQDSHFEDPDVNDGPTLLVQRKQAHNAFTNNSAIVSIEDSSDFEIGTPTAPLIHGIVGNDTLFVVTRTGVVTMTASYITETDTTEVSEAGTIRFDGDHFWGYNGLQWVALDSVGASGEGGPVGEINASDVKVNTSNFNRNLSMADSTVQRALDTLDDLVTGSGGYVWEDSITYSYTDTFYVYSDWTSTQYDSVLSYISNNTDNNSFKVVILNPGTYTEFSLNSIGYGQHDRVHFKGTHRDSVIINRGGTGSRFAKLQVVGVRIENMTIYSSTTSGAISWGLGVGTYGDNSVVNCKFIIAEDSYGLLMHYAGIRTTIANCEFVSNSSETDDRQGMSGGLQDDDLVIDNCIFTDLEIGVGFYTYGTVGFLHSVTNCSFYGCDLPIMWTASSGGSGGGCAEVVISDNTAESCVDGIQINVSSTSIVRCFDVYLNDNEGLPYYFKSTDTEVTVNIITDEHVAYGGVTTVTGLLPNGKSGIGLMSPNANPTYNYGINWGESGSWNNMNILYDGSSTGDSNHLGVYSGGDTGIVGFYQNKSIKVGLVDDTAPSARVHVVGAGTTTGKGFYHRNSGGNPVFYTLDEGKACLYRSGGGNILELVSNDDDLYMSFDGDDNEGGLGTFNNASNPSFRIGSHFWINGGNALDFRLNSPSYASYMTLDSDGLGIGITDPTVRLQVYKASPSAGEKLVKVGTAANNELFTVDKDGTTVTQALQIKAAGAISSWVMQIDGGVPKLTFAGTDEDTWYISGNTSDEVTINDAAGLLVNGDVHVTKDVVIDSMANIMCGFADSAAVISITKGGQWTWLSNGHGNLWDTNPDSMNAYRDQDTLYVDVDGVYNVDFRVTLGGANKETWKMTIAVNDTSHIYGCTQATTEASSYSELVSFSQMRLHKGDAVIPYIKNIANEDDPTVYCGGFRLTKIRP